ncbi:putative phosphoglycerate mutase family protein [Sulfitobacter noctilucae]|uniref:histidine phosphatase family protein n=1 Tax=Sulfitobacter noctilucae TaxID=1342302 RepID=UPI00046A2959|nr:histidine phosphatase family protein [Sulfitobacter noctilucae]KIN70529.1 putative phosphoglycerate mutase family protein [Sulfitobacter noctilucae]
MIRLALLRHGHTQWNREGRVQGRTDISLDPIARDELGRRSLPTPWAHADLVSSPLSRAVETAKLVSGRAPRTEAALMEMDWGDWEGRRAEELRADPDCDHRDIESWGWQYTPPNGESPDALRRRLDPWVRSLTNDTVAVCHIGVMRVILGMATDWNFDGPAPFTIKRNRLFVVRIDKSEWMLEPEQPRLVEDGA